MTIDEAVFELVAGRLKDYCQQRTNEGADRKTINRELELMMPAIKEWQRQQREWIEHAMGVLSAPSQELH